MDFIRNFFAFWKNFLIGDDWIAAIIVLAGFTATYFAVRAGIIAFWIMPVATLIALTYHLVRKAASNS